MVLSVYACATRASVLNERMKLSANGMRGTLHSKERCNTRADLANGVGLQCKRQQSRTATPLAAPSRPTRLLTAYEIKVLPVHARVYCYTRIFTRRTVRTDVEKRVL
eukprot:954927-Rhodomonas_salina.4